MRYKISFFRYAEESESVLKHVVTNTFNSDGMSNDMFSMYDEVNADESPLADRAEELADQINNEFNMELREIIDQHIEGCIEHVLDEASVHGRVRSDELFDFEAIGELNIIRLSERILDKLTENYEYKTVFDDGETQIVTVRTDERKHGRMVITRIGE